MRHLNNTIRGLAALLISLLFLIGIPAGLIAYVGWPLPTSLPTLDQIQAALRGGIDPQIVINVLAVIVWLVWAQLVLALTVELVAAIRGSSPRRLPVLPGLQPAVAQLVAAITLAVATLGPLRAVPATATPLPAEISPASSHPLTDVVQEPAPPTWAEAAPQRQAESHQPTYRVMRHDTLWSIAEITLGDGRRWAEIRALNHGRTMPDGHHFTEATDRLNPGWVLLLPDDATTPDKSTQRRRHRDHRPAGRQLLDDRRNDPRGRLGTSTHRHGDFPILAAASSTPTGTSSHLRTTPTSSTRTNDSNCPPSPSTPRPSQPSRTVVDLSERAGSRRGHRRSG